MPLTLYVPARTTLHQLHPVTKLVVKGHGTITRQ